MRKIDERPSYEKKEYLSRKEVARILGVSRQTIANYVERGLLIENPNVDGIRTPRLYSSSLKTLLGDGYDVVEQQRAIRQARVELNKEWIEVAKQKDRLRQTREEIGGKLLFHNYMLRLKDLLQILVSQNNELPERTKEMMKDILDGRSFFVVAEKYHITYQRVSQIFQETIMKLKRNNCPSGNPQDDNNERPNCNNTNLKGMIPEIREFDEDKLYHLPEILIGQKNLYKLFSVRPANALSVYGVENAYELALISPEELKVIRNLGEKSLMEIRQKMTSMGVILGDMASLRNPIIEKMTEKDVVLLDEIISRRQALSKRKHNVSFIK